jgi:class 3 adenylate cyclase
MCACGLPLPDPDNAFKAVSAALDMQHFVADFGQANKIQNLPTFEVRIGIHTGPLVAGVVGLKKFAYDIWGDAVNLAAQMEQHGEPGKVNISAATYNLVKGRFHCIDRGKIVTKSKGDVEMYFVESAKKK